VSERETPLALWVDPLSGSTLVAELGSVSASPLGDIT
jgi:hypothetical protein